MFNFRRGSPAASPVQEMNLLTYTLQLADRQRKSVIEASCTADIIYSFPVSEMTYTVSIGSFNPIIPNHIPYIRVQLYDNGND